MRVVQLHSIADDLDRIDPRLRHEAVIQGETSGHNIRAHLERRLRDALERASIAETSLASWRERALAAEALVEQLQEAIDELIEAYAE